MGYRAPAPLDKHHQLDDFSCGEAALDDWLKRHAIGAQASETARVYVTTSDDSDAVVGYYALAAAEVLPRDSAPRARAGQPAGRAIPAIVLARLAVDALHQGVGIGCSLLQDAILRTAQAADSIGARLLLVHAKHDAARAWYLQYGFEPSPTDPLHLQLLMKDIRRFIRHRP